MKYIVEYHLIREKMIGRECETEAEMVALVNSFNSSRKGVHDWTFTDQSPDQHQVRIVIPLDQVMVIRSYSTETLDDGADSVKPEA
jgi:hypothetical protein